MSWTSRCCLDRGWKSGSEVLCRPDEILLSRSSQLPTVVMWEKCVNSFHGIYGLCRKDVDSALMSRSWHLEVKMRQTLSDLAKDLQRHDEINHLRSRCLSFSVSCAWVCLNCWLGSLFAFRNRTSIPEMMPTLHHYNCTRQDRSQKMLWVRQWVSLVSDSLWAKLGHQ